MHGQPHIGFKYPSLPQICVIFHEYFHCVICIVCPDALRVVYVTSVLSTHQGEVDLYVKLSVI